MTDADRADFATCYQNVHIATRNRDTVTANVINIYFQAVKPLPLWAVKEASENLILNSKFPPTTADWRLEAERILQARQTPRLTSAPVSFEPEQVARIRAAKQTCVDELRAKPANPHIDWNRIADVIERIPLAAPPKFHCGTCKDTGWREETCQAGDRCGRAMCAGMDDSHTHTQVAPCVCRGSNPKLMTHERYDALKATRMTARRKYA